MAAVEEVRFDSAFTFIFSARSGTEAAGLPDQLPYELKRERLERLVDVVQRIAAERNAERIGGVEEVLVEGTSRTDPTRLRGRTRRNTTVNFSGAAEPRRACARRDRERDVHDTRRAAVRARRGLTHIRHGSVPDTCDISR